MRKHIGMFLGIAAMMAAQDSQSGESYIKITNPYADLGQYGSGTGAGMFFGYTSPIYIPYKHPIQTYRSQQRAAKKRRK
jgi:hypothetical protein